MDAKWEYHKDEIVSLYREHTAQEVRDRMRRNYLLDATPQQYERRLKKWGVRKNLKAEEWRLIGRRIAKRKAEDNKESKLMVDGYPFPQKRVVRAVSRYYEGTLDRVQREQRKLRSPTPDGCQILTPAISTLASPEVPMMLCLALDEVPLLQFQRFVAQKFTVFQGFLSHLADDQNDLRCIAKSTPGPSRSAQYDTLVFQAVNESSLTLASPSVTQEALCKFFQAVLHTSNHTWGYRNKQSDEAFQKLVMDVLTTMIKTSKTRSLLLDMISEQNPTFEALVEVAFRTALLQRNVKLVKFLIKFAKANPNAPIPISGSHCSPMEIAITEGSFTVAKLLINLGADLRKNCSIYHQGALLDYLITRAPPKLLQHILDHGFVNTFNAIMAFQRYGHGEMARKALENAVHSQRIYTTQTLETLEDAEFALSALRAAVGINSYQIAERIMKNCRRLDLEVMDEPGNGLVFLAVNAGSLDMVRLLLRDGVDVNVPGPLGISPLTIAIMDGNLHIAKRLIDWGASIERCSGQTETPPTPLQAAAFKGFHEIASILIARGANIEANPSTVSYGEVPRELERVRYPLHKLRHCSALKIAASYPEADDLGMVQLLVERGANVDTYLDAAIRFARKSRMVLNLGATDQIVRYLLSSCSSLPMEEALHSVIERGFMQSLQLIVERAGGNGTLVPSDISNLDPRSQLRMVSCLIEKGVKLRHSDGEPMKFSGDLYTTNPALAELLLHNNAHVYIFRDLDDMSFNEDDGEELEKAARHLLSAPPHSTLLQDPCFGHSTLVRISRSGRFDIVRSLLEWGVCIASPCAISTVLQVCAHGETDDLCMLLSLGAPVNLERDFKCDCWDELAADISIDTYTPIQVAARRGRLDIVEILLQSGALIDDIGEAYTLDLGSRISEIYHRTANNEYTYESTLSLAVEGGLEMVKLILAAGADVHQPPHRLGGRTVLQKAAQVGDIQIVEYLLEHQHVDINAGAAKWRGVTALQAAAINSHFDIAHRLLELGADPNAPGAEQEGRTALEGAAERGRIDIIQLLLDNGADISSTGFGALQFEIAVGLARVEGFCAAARMLERYREALDVPQ